MGFWAAQHFLRLVATTAQRERQLISRVEITKKINEIKYLSTQKKVPVLTLRREIQHLEDRLHGVFAVEKKLAEQKKHETSRVAALKRQISVLKKQLSAVQDPNVQQKIERLSHLLGEYLAHQETADDIELRQKVMEELQVAKNTLPPRTSAASPERVVSLRHRLEALKQELLITQEREKVNPEKVRLLEEQVQAVELRLEEYEQRQFAQKPIQELSQSQDVVKHNVLLQSVAVPQFPEPLSAEDLEIEKELPLPPPPKMKVKYTKG
ncbi:TPA: hypothetical protein HA241_07280 [Candidatus Woesearchaeota archaeon]|nr:hypothetical protein [Candidatus Woesearchaeota archaeon]